MCALEVIINVTESSQITSSLHLQIFTSVLSWGALSEKHIYQLVVYENTRPERPDEPQLTDDLWNIIEGSWHHEPRSRPSESSSR